MLNKQCPQCGSFNDEKAEECYFCHKEFPGAKKHSSKSSAESSAVTMRLRTGPPPHMKTGEWPRPGCVSLLAFLFFLIAGYFLLSAFCCFSALDAGFVQTVDQSIVGFLYMLAAYIFSPFNAFIMAWANNNADILVIVLFVVSGIAMVIGWGLWNTTRWSRILFMILLGAIGAGSLGYVIPDMISSGIKLPKYLSVLPDPVLYFMPLVIVLLIIAISVFPFLWFANNGKYFKH